MTCSLEKHGDQFEMCYWPLLEKDFSNYEIFWRDFIVPLTERMEGRGVQLREGTDSLLETIAMAHYSVFYHLGVAYVLLSKNYEFREDILFHLSSATEMVERLIFNLAKLQMYLEQVESIRQYTIDEICEKANEYACSSYKKDFEKFRKRGQTISIRLHNIEDVIKPFLGSVSDDAINTYKDWVKCAREIRHYRNTLAHNPKLGALMKREDNRIYVPKESKLNDYELWSDIRKRNDGDFMEFSDLLLSFQKDLIKKTNDLWKYLIDFMKQASSRAGYKKLIPKIRDISIKLVSSDTQPDQPQPTGYITPSGVFLDTPPSGTYLDDQHNSPDSNH